EHFQEALRINTAARGEGHPLNAVILFNLANNAHTQGRLEEARTLGLRALAVQEATSERGSLELLPFLIELTQIEAKLGDCDAALERGQRQVALALDHDASPVALADARAYFADALWICKRDRPRALALFRESESIFAAAGEAEKLEQLRANWRGRDARG
ncbi:MAG: tetratricopeptide repeat protein, partial [Nannocystaceae bacterium]